MSWQFAYLIGKVIPLNSGDIRNMVKQPLLENWPKHASRKNNGIPHRNSMIRYGTRKAPVDE